MTKVVYKRLDLENTYSYRKCSIPLEGQGLVFIRGLNIDDGGFLGAGKSSIFEALSVVQMGSGGKSTTMAEMLNHQAGKDLLISLHLSIDGKDYKFQLAHKHGRYGNGTRVIDMDTGANVLPSKVHAHKYIRKQLLKTTPSTFFHLTYLAQRMTNVLLAGTDAQRKNKVTEMFELDVYDALADYVDSQLKLAETDLRQLEVLETEMQELTNVLEDNPPIDKIRSRLAKKNKKLEAKQVLLDAALDSLREKEAALREAEERRSYVQEVRELWHDNPDLHEDIEAPPKCTKSYIERLRTELSAAQEEHASLKNSLRTLDQRDILQTQLKKIGETEIDFAAVNEELTEVKSRLRILQNTELPQAEARQEILQEMHNLDLPDGDLKESKSKLSGLQVSKSRLMDEIAEAKAQLEGNVCPTCKRPFNKSAGAIGDIEESLKRQRGELKSVTQEIHVLEKAVEALEKHQELQTRLDAIQTRRKVEAVQAEIRVLTSKERKLSAAIDSSQRREAILNQLKSLPEGDAASIRKKTRKTKYAVEKLEQKLDAAKTIRDRLVRINKMRKITRKAASDGVKKGRTEVHALTKELAAIAEKTIALKNQLQEVTDASSRKAKLVRELDKVRDLADKAECYRALKVAFGQKGLKHDRLHLIMQEAAERTVPVYSNALWPNRQVSLDLEPVDNAIRFQLVRNSGHNTSSRGISGGESHKAGLAFLFGLRDLKEIYTSYSCNVLIMDEPFSHLDPQGKMALLQVLNMLKSKFSSIFVVDHSTGVAQSDIWDQVWWAVRENDESTLYTKEPPAKYLKLCRRYEEELAQ